MLVALSLVAAGCGGEDSYSEDVEKNFTTECVKELIEAGDGALTEAQADGYCQCTFDDIKANAAFDEFSEFGEKVREDESTPPPPKMAASAQRCAASLG